jgi:hypothetical protein
VRMLGHVKIEVIEGFIGFSYSKADCGKLNGIFQSHNQHQILHFYYDFFIYVCRITARCMYHWEKGCSLNGVSQYTSLHISHRTDNFMYVTLRKLNVLHFTAVCYYFHVSYYILLQYVNLLRVSYYTYCSMLIYFT